MAMTVGLGTASAQENASSTLFEDDFSNGFSASGSEADWFYFGVYNDGTPLFVGNDGKETTSPEGLQIVAPGTNPKTGEPAFTKTLAQEDENQYGLPGGLDHVKWLAYTNRQSTNSVPGYDAVSGQKLSGGARISGRTYGTEGHPFGSAVKNPNDDLRLASSALNAVDLETWMVFDFFVTNERIYAFYERLPFGRAQLGNYAAFSYQIPVQEREPGDWHDLRIEYDRSAGLVRWLVDDEEVFRVDKIGRKIDRKYLTIDHGGVEETVSPRQLNFGMGTFSLLDGDRPSGDALVRLSNAQDFYFDPSKPKQTQQTFVDDQSRESSRLFGQGAELRVQNFEVESYSAADAD